MSTPPDYGEPWQKSCAEMYIIDRHGDAGCIVGERKERAIACVNACQNMANPAAEIEMLKLACERAIDAADAVQEIQEERDRLRLDLEATSLNLEAMREVKP